MRIQWNSEAAQEVLERLKRSEGGLDEGMRQAHALRLKLEEANAQGDDDALTKLTERLETCMGGLRELSKQFDDFRRAVRRSDAEFDEAEHRIVSAVNKLDTGAPPTVDDNFRPRTNWEASAFAVMPELRTGAVPIPDWLDRLTAQSSGADRH